MKLAKRAHLLYAGFVHRLKRGVAMNVESLFAAELGEGGMGEVWVADQQELVQRQVALKVIRDGMGSARMLARFEAERQTLALMDHPNVGKVLDAGVADGRPFFVMERIEGEAIT